MAGATPDVPVRALQRPRGANPTSRCKPHAWGSHPLGPVTQFRSGSYDPSPDYVKSTAFQLNEMGTKKTKPRKQSPKKKTPRRQVQEASETQKRSGRALCSGGLHPPSGYEGEPPSGSKGAVASDHCGSQAHHWHHRGGPLATRRIMFERTART